MAQIVGVPKREPCQQCGNPVFFAERLPIGRFLYHRTCLKCARCGSQLSPGSFYETENDGVFCCETCPDEEKKIQLDIKTKNHISPELGTLEMNQQRQSFSEKLAMFETDGKGLLQRSMSDEEKSKSLKRLSELNGLISKRTILEASTSAIVEQEIEKQNDGSNELDSNSSPIECDEDVAPPLPKSQPPSFDTIACMPKPNLPPIAPKVNVLNKLKMQTNPMKTKPQVCDPNPSSDEQYSKASSESAEDHQTELFNKCSSNELSVVEDITNSYEKHVDRNAAPIQQAITSEFSLGDTSIDVTKDINEIKDHTKVETANRNRNYIDSNTILEHGDISIDSPIERESNKYQLENGDSDRNENKFRETNNGQKQSVIELINSDLDSDNMSIRNDTTTICNNNDDNQVVRSRLCQFEDVTQTDFEEMSHKCNSTPKLERVSISENNETKSIGHDERPQSMAMDRCKETMDNAINDRIEKKSCIDIESNENDSLSVKNERNFDSEKTDEKPTPSKRLTMNMNNVENDSSLPPTPMRRRNRVNATENEHEQINMPVDSLSHEKDEEPATIEYPEDLNPFDSDDEQEKEMAQKQVLEEEPKNKQNFNPFDSDDDEIELLKGKITQRKTSNNSNRMSTNPFGSESEDENETNTVSLKRTPIPTPRKPINGSSLYSTPEPSPRMSHTLNPRMRTATKLNGDIYGSSASIASSTNSSRVSNTLNRMSQVHGSMSSLASSSTPRHKKGRAPDIPVSTPTKSNTSTNNSPSHSIRATPISTKKKRAAPLPPKSSTFDIHKAATLKLSNTIDTQLLHESILSNESLDFDSSVNIDTSSIESPYTSTTSETQMISNESAEATSNITKDRFDEIDAENALDKLDSQRKLIPADSSLLDDFTIRNIAERPADGNIIYRRKIVPDHIVTPTIDRQCEKMKENKESQNKNRQCHVGMPNHASMDDSNQLYGPNKSSYGKWKRRKGPAPSLPIPPRKVIQMLPLQEIRHELEVIEVQQQGLEKQGVILEKMIRERCEGTENENKPLDEFKPNTKEVEDLILQLFELVNEKNELFRRQAELMYLRRQHRLEQEQADIEYEIRVLMAQPECNKTDSDKAREEALISRMIEVVQLRNQVIESLEMDRIREAEEDQSIKERLELHTAKLDEDLCQQTPTKLSKKEKKKQKESKKLAKQKKIDAEKDADESEIGELDKSKEKKKKKKFLF